MLSVMHMDTEGDWYTNLTDEHFLEVGRAVTEWGELEMLVYSYLEEFTPFHSLYEFLAKEMRNFSARCDLLEVLVSAKAQGEDKVQELATQLSRAKALAKDRNLLAHNPIQFWIDETDSKIVGGVVHSRTGKSADFDIARVKEFSYEAHELRFKIMNAVLRAVGRHA
jgi:hypothetical protein